MQHAMSVYLHSGNLAAAAGIAKELAPYQRSKMAFSSWLLRVTCDRCGKDRMFAETHFAQRDMLLRKIIKRMRHDADRHRGRHQPAGQEDRAAGRVGPRTSRRVARCLTAAVTPATFSASAGVATNGRTHYRRAAALRLHPARLRKRINCPASGQAGLFLPWPRLI